MLKQFHVTGTLPVGAEVDGVIHREFEMRPPTVGDLMAGDIYPGVTGKKAASLRRVLVRLGELRPAQISDALIQGLSVPDFEALLDASDRQHTDMLTFRAPPLEGGDGPGAGDGVERG